MSYLILGMQCVHGDAIAADHARQERLADLVVDPRWVYRLKLINSAFIPQTPREPRFVGVVPAARMRDATLETLASPYVTSTLWSISKQEKLDHAHLKVTTGRDAPREHGISSNASWRVPPDVDLDASATAWVELQHAIVDTLGATNGVIVTATNDYVLYTEVFLSFWSIDGKVMHPRPDEISAYHTKSRLLGDTHVRRPRWGTYLKPAHVAALGGRDRIIEVVKPDIVRDVGELLYVQLTARASEATSEAAKARFRAFDELVAPIALRA